MWRSFKNQILTILNNKLIQLAKIILLVLTIYQLTLTSFCSICQKIELLMSTKIKLMKLLEPESKGFNKEKEWKRNKLPKLEGETLKTTALTAIMWRINRLEEKEKSFQILMDSFNHIYKELIMIFCLRSWSKVRQNYRNHYPQPETSKDLTEISPLNLKSKGA